MQITPDTLDKEEPKMSAHCTYKINEPPKPSQWQCHLFGLGGWFVLCPPEGQVPNWFWRAMQFLILGNRWRKL